MSTGWYVHHHGAGHLTRARAVVPALREPVVLCSSLPRPPGLPPHATWVSLPRDDTPLPSGRSPREADPEVGGLLHWAPLHHAGHRERLLTMAAAFAEHGVQRVVVDVSAEVTLWCRLQGLPVVMVAQPGDRRDLPHALARAAAARVLVPWPAAVRVDNALDDGPTGRRPDLRFVGGISRFGEREVAGSGVGCTPGRRVLLLGSSVGAPAAASLRRALTDAGWQADWIGGSDGRHVDDPWSLLVRADVVVSAAGQNSVADLAAVGARAVLVPQERPFGEQHATARALEREGLARVVAGPASVDALLAAIEEARTTTPDWSVWGVTGAVDRAAAVIEEVGP